MFAISTLFDRRHRRVVIFVAGTRAVPKFGHRVVCIAVFFMLARFVVVCMASGTIRCICGARVGNGLCVALVAIEAIEGLCMRTWIVR